MDNGPSGLDKLILELCFPRNSSSLAIRHHALDESGCGGSLTVGGSDFSNISFSRDWSIACADFVSITVVVLSPNFRVATCVRLYCQVP